MQVNEMDSKLIEGLRISSSIQTTEMNKESSLIGNADEKSSLSDYVPM